MSKLRGRHREVAARQPPPSPLADSNLKNRTSCHTKTMKGYYTKRASSSILSMFLLCVVPISCQQQQQQQQQLNNLLQQYPRHSPQNLVNTLPQPAHFHSNSVAADGLPLSRQQFNPATDLDNVIESTVATPRQPQPFAASLVARPTSSGGIPQAPAACQLPPTWTGRWHQANKEPIRVTNTEISDKGICRDKKGDKYLFEYSKQPHQTCLYCLVINERHLNVLQYKESSCQPVPNQHLNRSSNSQLIIDSDHSLLDSICSDITGDTQLESLFRLDTPAIECPINGKYQFTYDNCQEPQSSIDSCIDKKQLHFRYNACPGVPGSESKSEILKCYADWSEGNNYYMIGRLEPASNHQDKGKFRCFVYEKSADGSFIQMGQSLEESCYGLINPHEDGRPLRLTRRQPTSNKCHFPWYIRNQSENWLSVDNSLIYMFNQNSTKYQVMETKEGNIIEEATCLHQFPLLPQAHQNPMQPQHLQARINPNQQMASTATNRRFSSSSNQFDQSDLSAQHQATLSSFKHNDAVYLIQITKSCYTTDYCVRFYRRASGIVQIDYFIALPGNDDQQRCRNAYTLNTPQTQIITSTNLEEQKCPFDGAYTIEAPLESDYTYNPSNIFMCPRQSLLTAQCEQPSRLSIHYKCSSAKFMPKNLKCLGSWTTNGLVRLLLADDDRQRYSAWYRDYGHLAGAPDETGDQNQATTRSQQLMRMSSLQTAATVVDLQIALVTPQPIVSKPMQVRLTRRGPCSILRGYPSPGLQSPYAQPAPFLNYAANSSGSSAFPSSINMFLLGGARYSSLALMIISLIVSVFFTTILPSTKISESTR